MRPANQQIKKWAAQRNEEIIKQNEIQRKKKRIHLSLNA